jgi:NTE family protein
MDATAAFLADVPLFGGAVSDAIDELAAEVEPVRLLARAQLFAAGEPADQLFVVRSGRLEVVAEIDGEERVVRIVGPGAVLGELALLTHAPRSALVRAVRDSELLALDAERWETLLVSHPELGLAVARELARQLQASGGLLPPQASPALFALVARRPTADVDRLRARLREELAALTPLATVGGHDAHDAAELVARLEAEKKVLLVATVDGDRAGWADFCLRQADRVVLVADDLAPPPGLDGRRCEVLFLGAPDANAVSTWLDALSPRTHHIVREKAFNGDVARAVRRLTGRAVGLVLSGGGARGYAHVGAYHALTRAGIEIDRVGGCSIGAFLGALIATGRTPAEIDEICRRELVARSPFNDYTVPKVALIRARKAARMLERLFGDVSHEQLARPLFTVSADLVTSELVVHRRGRVMETVGASMSIPGIAPPFSGWGRLLVDGGVLNNLPVDAMAEADEGPIIAVDVMRRLRVGDEGEPAAPTIMETLARATVLGSVERAEGNRRLADVVVVPDVQDVGLRAWRRYDAVVEAGRRAAEEALADGGLEALTDADTGAVTAAHRPRSTVPH